MNLVTRLLENLLVGLFAILCCLAFGEVVFRYLLNQPHAWSEEASIYLFTWVSFLGAALAFRRRRHVGISYFVDKLSPRWQAGCECLAHLFVLGFLGLLLVQAIRFTLMNHTLNSIVLQIPLSWVAVSLSVMTLLMVVYTLDMLRQAARRAASTSADHKTPVAGRVRSDGT